VTGLLQMLDQPTLELEAGVVAAEVDAHGRIMSVPATPADCARRRSKMDR
jgi:hypothetical protein